MVAGAPQVVQNELRPKDAAQKLDVEQVAYRLYDSVEM